MSILDAPALTKNQADFRYGRNQGQNRLIQRSNGIPLRASTLGNSIFAGVSGISFIDQAILSSGPRMTWIRNGGVAGNTSAMMLARVNTDVPSDSDVCFIMEGSNDGLNAVSVTTHRQNMEAIIINILGRGITPILVTSAPLTTKAAQVTTYIAVEQALAAKYNISIYDPWKNVISTATGEWIVGLTADSVHPTFAAAITAKSDMVSLIKGESVTQFSPRSNSSGLAGYCISGGNCLMLTDANADGVPDGWALAGTASGSLVDALSPFVGKMARLTSTSATGNPYLYKTITSGWQANDELLVSCVVDTNSGLSPQQTFLTIRVDGVEVSHINGSVVSFPAQRMMFKIKPATTQQIQFYLKVNGAGNGSYISIGEFEVYNLTALLSR
jgi:hypothetical protein